MKKYDLIVIGGGLSGVACAVSAKREGLSVLLIERSGCLGGAISQNLVYPFMKYWDYDSSNKNKTYLSAGIFTEMRKLAKTFEPDKDSPSYDFNPDMNFNPEAFKRALDKMIVESGVDILFHSYFCGVTTD